MSGIDPVKHWKSFSKKERARLLELDPVQHDRLLTAHDAEMGRRDFWFFLKNILRNPVLYEPLHRPLADWCSDWSISDSKMLLMSRGHVKSNIFTIEHSVWEAARNPNIRIGIASHKSPDAAKFLWGIKRYITHHPNFKKHYPDIVPMPGQRGRWESWAVDKATLQRDVAYVDGTFEILSPGADTTGRHYDLMKLDDLVTNDNKTNPSAVREFYELCESLLVGDGRKALIGTRYAYDDLYGDIIDTPEKRETYDIRIQSCFTAGNDQIIDEFIAGREYEEGDDEKYLVYPSHFTLRPKNYQPPQGGPKKKSLILVRKRQGSLTFANQYKLEPYDPSDVVFDENDIKIIYALPSGEYDYYQLCDLASEHSTGNTKDPAFVAIVTACIDKRCNIFITDIWWGDRTPMQVVDFLIGSQRVPQKVRPFAVAMEPGPYELAIRPWLETKMGEEGVFVPIYPLPGAHHIKAKDEKIGALQPWVQAGKFHILNSCPHKEVLIEEMVKFPAFSRKDILDACAQLPKVALPSDWEQFMEDSGVERVQRYGAFEEPEPEPTGDDLLAELMRRDRKGIGAERVMRRGVRRNDGVVRMRRAVA